MRNLINKYNLEDKVLIYSRSLRSKNYCVENNLNYFELNETTIKIYPDDIYFGINIQLQKYLEESEDFDVFIIYKNGNIYKYYNNKSNDNALVFTDYCNSNCIMCPTSNWVRKNGLKGSKEELINLIKYLPSDSQHITLTGGEPFLLGMDIFPVLDKINNHFLDTEFLLLTNGRIFCIKEYVEKLNDVFSKDLVIGIPIHGHTSEIHDLITRSTGSFDQTLIGINNLLKYNFKVELRIVVSKVNSQYIEKITDLISKEFPNIYRIRFIGLEMLGNARLNKENVWISYTESFKSIKDSVDKLVLSGIDVGLYNYPLCSIDKRYWPLTYRSITDYKINYSKNCSGCSVIDACGGVFQGTLDLAENEIRAIDK